MNMGRDEAYSTALDQIKRMLAKYRTDVTQLRGNAILSPRILMLLIERSESHVPADILVRLRPLADAVLNRSELGISKMLGVPIADKVQSEIRTQAESAYEALAKLHDEVMSRT